MRRSIPVRALLPLLLPSVLTLLAAGCGGGAANTGDTAADTTAVVAPAAASSEEAAYAFTEADLDAWERGLAKEIELVRAAQARASAAATPQARGEATQAQWAETTVPQAAQSLGAAGVSYAATRRTVHRVLETLDFQGKIDGPMSLDTTNVAPELRARMTMDPYAELAPASAAALRARLDRVVPRWIEYVKLTAVAG
ncbi:hypothetical protein [Roseisolibacter agri]|nr:hypothetical protein [Roseisolibacter agri]